MTPPFIEDFINYTHYELNRSPLTSGAYRRDIMQFAEWVSPDADFEPLSITMRDVRGWLGYLSRNGNSAVSIRRKTQSLRAFFKFLVKRDMRKDNPASDVILAKLPRHLPSFISTSEMEDLLIKDCNSPQDAETPQQKYISTRNHLAINMLYSLGLRQAELIAIRDEDISMSYGELKVTGKRNKQRILPLPPELAEEISSWQKVRDSHRNPEQTGNTYLFPGTKGHISPQMLYKIVNNYLESTSSSKKSPHVLRHSFATAMLNNGAGLNSVKEMLGHASLSTTQIYTHLNFSQLHSDYIKAHPRARNEKTEDNG